MSGDSTPACGLPARSSARGKTPKGAWESEIPPGVAASPPFWPHKALDAPGNKSGPSAHFCDPSALADGSYENMGGTSRTSNRLAPGLGLLCSAAAVLGCSAELTGGADSTAGPSASSGFLGAAGASARDATTSDAETDSTDGTMPSTPVTSFSCEPESASDSPPLRRLTRIQYESTLRDLLRMALQDESEAQTVMEGLAAELSQLHDDTRIKVPEDLHGTYRRLDQTVQQTHVDNWFAIGERAGELLSESQRMNQLLGPCAESATNDEEASVCLEDFIAQFGRLALRRPLTDNEIDLYQSFYEPSTGIDPEGFADVVTGLLNAPQFLYVIEHGTQEVAEGSNTFRLSAHELASRLSYHFWNSMPDTELMALADSGELLEPNVYEEQVRRLWADERTHDTITHFFREWLKLEDLPELDGNNEATIYQNFAGEDLPSPELRQAMIDEVLDLLNYYTWQQPTGIHEIFLTPYSFAKSEELANLYGVPVWDGSGTPPELEGERPGLLTRAAFLATGTANTRPIMKGVFIRTNILCDDIPPPPENANAIPPELSPELTTREVVEALTEGPDNPGCASCHENYINPLGFATENFDSLGRPREEQLLFDSEGAPIGSRPVDTRTVPQVILGDRSEVDGPAELMDAVVSSGKIEACFARHYFRFSFGRFEGVEKDGCVLEQMRSSLEETGSLADMLRSVALSDAFQRRTFTPDTGTQAQEDQ